LDSNLDKFAFIVGFHAALADSIAAVAPTVRGLPVILSGGAFQNVCLVDAVNRRVPVFTQQRIPPDDGEIALGQTVLSGSYSCV
jgi:hydrogenase maturation factor HypF (carbamoyltransferase family)